MTHLAKKAVLGTVLGAAVLTAAAPAADAQRYGGYRGGHYGHYDRHYRGDGGTAVVAGIAGLAIGAAIASSNDRRYDYDRSYYRDRGYYPPDGYYYRDYYRRHPGWADCYVRRQWDPYMGRPVMVRYCD